MKRLLVCFLGAALAFSGRARDLTRDFPLELKTRYFEIHYQRAAWNVAALGRFADGFVEVVNRDFLKVTFPYPIKMLVLSDRTTFQEFLRREIEVPDPPNYGIYLPRYETFVTYEDSGLGTFAHEIMHPFVERNLPARPEWAVEAIPSFFEKFYGYYAPDVLVAQWGYQNPWRIEALGPKLTTVDLESIVAGKGPHGTYDTSELRLIAVFLWRQGRFPRFLQLIARQERAGYATYFEAAMGLPLNEVIPLWRNYLAEIAAHRAEIYELPASAVFDDRESLVAFMRANHVPAADGASSPAR